MKQLYRIITSRPADRVASRVTQPGPKGLESKKRPSGDGTQAMPWPMRAVPANVPDLTGRVSGFLTVVGLSHFIGNSTNGSPARWVCRCICGYYVIRKPKTIRRQRDECDACDRCRELQFLKRQQAEIASGEYVPSTSGVKFKPLADV